MELLRSKLHLLVEEAARRAVLDGALPDVAFPDDAPIERPQNPSHGDYASSVGMKLARHARMNPMQIAEAIAERVAAGDEIESVSAAPPGFVNFVLSGGWLKQQVDAILAEGDRFGNVDIGEGRRVQVEFVSSNPTGPVHVGHARGAVLGSTLANALASAGFAVHREFYVNDTGSQMENFYRSLYARAAQQLGMDVEVPAEGYAGDYVVEAAKQVLAESADPDDLESLMRNNPEQATKAMAAPGLQLMLTLILEDLDALNVTFDEWFSEQSLFQSGEYDGTLRLLAGAGYLAEREGATWFVSSALGEDKDNVVVRSTGAPTYFASDIAYHRNKLAKRGFDRVIDIWGADHQGHVSRMKAAMSALGIEPSRLEILISQLVTLKRGGETVRLSKRTGDIITLREVVEEVGADACRYFLLSKSADSQMDFDLALAVKESQENPVYYVQYAHARIASVLRLADERGVGRGRGNVSLLSDEAELALIRRMLQLPEVVDQVASSLEPHHLPHYAQELATAFHWFYKQCRVVSSDAELTGARLKLVEAARIVLARTLGLMGMSAPEQM